MTTELYALKHNDITLADEPKRLLVTVRNGKTGMRIANTLEGAVAPYKRLCQRYPDAKGEDYIFLPHYENRATAARVFARQFNALLEETELKMDAVLQTQRTIYSLRHSAICMRIILSQGKVNIFNLAKNAGTSAQSDRTLLCPQPAAVARAREEPAEFWGGVGGESFSGASPPLLCRSYSRIASHDGLIPNPS